MGVEFDFVLVMPTPIAEQFKERASIKCDARQAIIGDLNCAALEMTENDRLSTFRGTQAAKKAGR